MSEAKHTPGPWYATTRMGSWDWLVAADVNNEICQMFHDGTEFNEIGEANARLIAAAPDLLEACHAMCRACMVVPMQEIETAIQSAYEMSRRAIAKAEGR